MNRPAVPLRQVEKDIAAALGLGELERGEHLRRRKNAALWQSRLERVQNLRRGNAHIETTKTYYNNESNPK